MLIAILAGLTGCVTLRPTETGTAMSANVGVYGATSLIDAQARSTAISDGVENGVPVSVTTTTSSGNRSTTETVSIGYVGPAMYGSYASSDWYGRGAAMVQDRAARTGIHTQESDAAGPVSAGNIAFDPNTKCPDKESTTVAERLACLQIETDTNTVAIESNPAAP